jgi:hypothetical protein
VFSQEYFREGLLTQMDRGSRSGFLDVLINAGELHRSLSGSSGTSHGMPSCCDAMEAEMQPGDILLLEPCNGAGMTVRYRLPRALKLS